MSLQLGVCYYPEQIQGEFAAQQQKIEEDLRTMAALGITLVRVGEFAWSSLEPQRNQFNWELLDTVFTQAEQAGLRVILGTPTATPPKWLIDERGADILARDANGQPRGFGSRRHYSFSSTVYIEECVRIVTELCKRYSKHPALGGWQTDNEYGCHDTTLCYAPFTTTAFREWLRRRYGSIAELNRAWGTAFWSQTYHDFNVIELPNQTVTTPHPAHVLAFRRFSSEQVRVFNAAQVAVIRKYKQKTHTQPIMHNFMGAFQDYDHFALSDDLDVVSWDNYPLGFLAELSADDAEHKTFFYDKGDPDYSAFYHDLYRSMGRHGWGIMELQPGPVNWARYNPIPYADPQDPSHNMQRLWAWEAFGHGAGFVSYFRFRQSAQAQEQAHTALYYANNNEAPAAAAVKRVRKEIKIIEDKVGTFNEKSFRPADSPAIPTERAKVVILYDYTAIWSYEIHAQAAGFSFFTAAFTWYRGLRALGIDCDFIAPTQHQVPASIEWLEKAAYSLVILPSNAIISTTTATALKAFVERGGTVIVGARSGSLTEEYSIPSQLPPGVLQELMGVRVPMVSTLPPAMNVSLSFTTKAFRPAAQTTNKDLSMMLWVEQCELMHSAAGTAASTLAEFTTGKPAVTVKTQPAGGQCYNFHGLPNLTLVTHFLQRLLQQPQLEGILRERAEFGLTDTFFPLPRGLRITRRHGLCFAFNYSRETVHLPVAKKLVKHDTELNWELDWLFGNDELRPGGVACWHYVNK